MSPARKHDRAALARGHVALTREALSSSIVGAMTRDLRTALPPLYYRDNFLRLCEAVQSQYGDMLLSAEQQLLQRFHRLDAAAQCLYVRLVLRTGPWFRERKLRYAEIAALDTALDLLLQAGLAQCATALAPAELGSLFSRRELDAMFATGPGARRFPDKGAQLAAIAALPATPSELALRAAHFDGARIVAPAGAELVALLQLLFFGNRRQGLAEFVLQDLGVLRYYPYSLSRAQRQFPCRAALDEYLACAALGDRREEALAGGEPGDLLALAGEVLAMTVRFPASTGRWHRLCNSLGRDLERQGATGAAAQLYRRSRQHPARERRARICERQGDWQAAQRLCEQMLAAPWCEQEQDAAARILARVQRRTGAPARRRPAGPGGDELQVALPAGDQPVELAAAQHLRTQWRAVHYVENSLMNALFGLAFWEQIFAPVPGAFRHAFQGAPTDMYDAEFLPRRRPALAARLAELRDGDCAAMLVDAYRRYRDYQCHWLDWRRVDAALVGDTARTMPAAHLVAIWERMLFDPRENRSGFPDLIALGHGAGDYCLVEVKSPGDRLQDSQRRWLRFFSAQGIPARVMRVTWRDD